MQRVLFETNKTKFRLFFLFFYLQVVTSQVNIVTVQGDHRTILTGESVEKIATVLKTLTE